MAGTNSRWVHYEVAGLDHLKKKKPAKGTDNATKVALTLFKTFCKETQKDTVNLENISLPELSILLQRFYVGARTPSREYYKLTTMNSFRFGLQRYFIGISGVNIITDPQFNDANSVFTNILRDIKAAGKGEIEHYPEIEPDDIRKLYASFDNSTPAGLQEKVWVDIMFYLCRRGRECNWKTVYLSMWWRTE